MYCIPFVSSTVGSLTVGPTVGSSGGASVLVGEGVVTGAVLVVAAMKNVSTHQTTHRTHQIKHQTNKNTHQTHQNTHQTTHQAYLGDLLKLQVLLMS